MTKHSMLAVGFTLFLAFIPLTPAQADDAERTYRESRAQLPDPERGFYSQRSVERLGGLDEMRGRGMTLVLLTENLRDFKDRDLTPEKLDELREALADENAADLVPAEDPVDGTP